MVWPSVSVITRPCSSSCLFSLAFSSAIPFFSASCPLSFLMTARASSSYRRLAMPCGLFRGRRRPCVGRKRGWEATSRGRSRAISASRRRPFRPRTRPQPCPGARCRCRGRVRGSCRWDPIRFARAGQSARAIFRLDPCWIGAPAVGPARGRSRHRGWHHGHYPWGQERVSGDRAPFPGPRRARTRSRKPRVAPSHRAPRAPLAGRPFELVRELVGVVGDEFGPVARTADRDVERALVDQVRVLRWHRREDPVHRPALEGVNGRRERTVDVSKAGHRCCRVFAILPSSRRKTTPPRPTDSTVAVSPLVRPDAGSLRVKCTRSPRRSSIASLR